MDRRQLPLNALRAFEAAARHLSFTRAAQELCITQAAVSLQVKGLEARLGVRLFRRVARGLALTDEGQSLVPVVGESLDRMARAMSRFERGVVREVLTIGVVGTFAVRWLMPRLEAFRELHPLVELRLLTHNNKVDLAAEGLDLAIRFGDGDWPGVLADEILKAPMTPLCSPQIAGRLDGPSSLTGSLLLRSYRRTEWPTWFASVGAEPLAITGPVFDSLTLMVHAATLGLGVALAPPVMFRRELAAGQLVQPFPSTCEVGAYWLTRLRNRPATAAVEAFRQWCLSPEFRGTA